MVAIADAKVLYTWGKNAEGQLGHGDREDRRHPTVVTTLLATTSSTSSGSAKGLVLYVSCGANHMAALVIAGSQDP